MRSASASMRAIDRARSSGRVSAPRRNSSAYPRIDVIGVRSSCEASPTNRRRRSSEARRSSNAASIWVSIALSEVPSLPISVSSSAGSTRRDRSPAAIAPAVSPIVSSGRNPIFTSTSASAPAHERDPDRDQRFDREQPSERGAHLGERHRDHEGSGARARPHRLDPEAAAPARGARGERHRADAAGRRPGEAGGQHGDGAGCPGGTRTSGSARRCPTHRAAPRSSRSGLRPKPAAARRASGILLPVRAP